MPRPMPVFQNLADRRQRTLNVTASKLGLFPWHTSFQNVVHVEFLREGKSASTCFIVTHKCGAAGEDALSPLCIHLQ